MADNKKNNGHGRRRFLKSIGAAAALGLVGCGGGASNKSGSSGSASSGGGGGSGLPSKAEGVEKWGKRINEYAQQASIDWQQFDGTALTFGMNVHPYTKVMKPLLPHFEELTGISVTFNTFPEDQLWQKLTLDLSSEAGVYDGYMAGLWPSARYHNAGWARNMTTLINDSGVTDKNWLSMEDYPDGPIDALTYQGELVSMPLGIEAYGCIGYDKPTFDDLGLSEPTTFEELLNAAKTIHESDKTDRAGICSRASSTTLSSANWATMFKTYGAEWIDRANRKALLNSKEGIASLEMFSDMMGNYGPGDIGTYDWYKSNQAFGNGQTGIVYHTPSAVGPFTEKQYQRTEWIPPLPGPNGGDPVASTWVWSLAISAFSQNPGAAWLFVQWATSRPALLLMNTKQWEGQPTYGPARSNWLFEQDEYQKKGLKASWQEAHKTGIEAVPSNPPPVPIDTPQNMDIMSQAAIAMNSAVTQTKDAKPALDEATTEISKIVKEIPEAYIASGRSSQGVITG